MSKTFGFVATLFETKLRQKADPSTASRVRDCARDDRPPSGFAFRHAARARTLGGNWAFGGAFGAIALMMAALGSPLWAHHSVTAEFDPNEEWTATGILKKVDWINPHTATWVEVKDESGKVETWGCEGNPPSTYSRAGVHREDWRVGEQVTITCLAAKDHSKHWGFLKQIKYHSDGHVLVFRLGGE
jgi:hypothetical protein